LRHRKSIWLDGGCYKRRIGVNRLPWHAVDRRFR
jgi:hypothetical protein